MLTSLPKTVFDTIILEPAAPAEAKTEQKKKIISKNNKITKTINKNIEKTMIERAVTGK